MVAERKRTLLAFDFGTKKIGIAVGQEQTGTARPLTMLRSRNSKPDWESIGRLLEEWRPEGLVVGIPLHMDGREQEMTGAARRFGRQLEQRYNLPVYFVDERLTSMEAGYREAERTGRRDSAMRRPLDDVAAQIILETWFEEQARQH